MIVPLCLLSLIAASPAAQDPHRYTYSAELNEEQTAWVEKTLASLTVREMAGQLMIDWTAGGYSATDSDQYDRSFARVEGGVGGLWVMGGLPHSLAATINELQARAKVPLLVMSSGDLGSRLYALPGPSWRAGGGTDVPSAMALAAADKSSYVRDAARIIGLESRAVGLNMISDNGSVNLLKNLANVLGNRTFGDDAQQAARLIEAFIEGAHSAGVISHIGFFPGAGNISGDPHVTLPVDPTDRREFETEDFVPFRAAIHAGAECFMTSHIAVPGLTGSETLPVTLSPEVTRILREELGFDGLLITDAMAMGGITNTYEAMDAAVLAFKAGNDLILGTWSNRAADKITELIESGELSIEQLKTSVRRILSLKAKLGLHKDRLVDLDAINKVVGRREHQAAMDTVAERSITLLRDEKKLVPFSSDMSVLSVTFERSENDDAGRGFNSKLRGGVALLESERVFPETESSVYDDLLNRAENVDRVVLSVYIRPEL
ncbi:MAG: hypothetical protein IH945_01250, partial [Armatimonadetes bacterium]|nr:hypothetical protein [Armatimonadota bacterium]